MLPHSRCNFITDDHKILVGAIPTSETINNISNFGITMIIDVQDVSNLVYKYVHYNRIS